MSSLIFYSLAIILFAVSFIKNKAKTKKAIKIALKSFENILPQFITIIIIVGITLSIIKPETISTLLGSESGVIGVFLSALIGSITMMPTFVSFQVGNTLLQNGAGYAQVTALVSTLTLVGILTFSLESSYIGKKAAFLRNFVAFLFSFIVAFIIGKVMMII